MASGGNMRFAVDTGGTFTDLIVADDDGGVTIHKAPTTPSDPAEGMLQALRLAAESRGEELSVFLARGSSLIHGTTHAINAIITQSTARTALLTTQGHRDVLVLREGGRSEPFNFTVPFPEPYVPRALTFEVTERVLADGRVRVPLDEASVVRVLSKLRSLDVESIAVCLLWSIVRPDHELVIGRLIEENLPGVPYTLSHQLNPTLREYRRASSTVIDASLKPLMTRYLQKLEGRLAEAGFGGLIFIVTSNAGLMPASEVAAAPIHLINSGPSMAPVAGLNYCRNPDGSVPDAIIVADTGGTTYDVSLVRKGRISRTADSWIGEPFRGHLTGFPSVDVRSIGAGGGSIASVNAGGMLTVGPRSAGAVPGPAAYGNGGVFPTLTDAALVLGYIDPGFFLGGAIKLDVEASHKAIKTHVADPLKIDVESAAHAIMRVATENMVQAIVDITVKQGIDPRRAILVGGGGAAGFNAVAIARRLGCKQVVIPEAGAALSAAGALMSDLSAHFRATRFTTSRAFDYAGVNTILAGLRDKGRRFILEAGLDEDQADFSFFCDARYPDQVWEIELPLPVSDFSEKGAVEQLVDAFHALHRDIFAVSDDGSAIEIVSWTLVASGKVGPAQDLRVNTEGLPRIEPTERSILTVSGSPALAPVIPFETMPFHKPVAGPALIENSFTTIFIEPGATAQRDPVQGIIIDIEERPT